MNLPPANLPALRFDVGDVVTSTSGQGVPWRIDAIAPGTVWPYNELRRYKGVSVYHLVSLTSGRRDQRATDGGLKLFTGTLPASTPAPSRVKGHFLVDEGAPYSATKVRLSRWGTRGPGHGLCSCGLLSELELPSAGQRKQWHRIHKDQVRKGQAA